MKIECSNCQTVYNIPDERLPQGKVAGFNCKKCTTKIVVDLRNNSSGKEKADNPAPTKSDSSSEQNQPGDPRHNGLKDKILKSIDELPPMPQVVAKTRSLLADSTSDAKKIAGVIETDQGIASKVLKIANSAYYGLSGKISTIQHATVVLGAKTLGEIVTMSGTAKLMNGKLPGYGYKSNDLWLHSLAVAQGAKIIANVKNPELLEEAHTAGLIHDVGKLILDNYVLERRAEMDAFMETEEKAFNDAEFEFFGFDHAEIASEICAKWHFPDQISRAIKCHHKPSESEEDELSYILHTADYVATISGIGYDDDDFLYELEEGTQDFLKLKQEDISNIVMEVTESVNKISF